MNLIVVESPTKARTLSRFLGSNFTVEATMGHVRDLPQDSLGVNIEKNFEPQYVLVKGKKGPVSKITKSAQQADKIYLASDPDREGEAIAYHIAWLLEKKTKSASQKIVRITFHEITDQAIKQALQHPGKINKDLVEAQTARRVLDRLVGYKLSPLLWMKIRKGLSAGRVQSVAVRLVVEREKEIEKFVPVEYWEIEVLLEKLQKVENGSFWAKLVKKDEKKISLSRKDETDSILEELKVSIWKVFSVEIKEQKRKPPPPFITSTMQQAAASRLGWTSKRTMNIAQDLYENGFITYHRTDSTNLAPSAVNSARSYIHENFSSSYLPQISKSYLTKSKNAQEAHEAIRPTDVRMTQLGENADQQKLYSMIWKRFLACQMNAQVMQITTVITRAEGKKNNYLFESRGEKEIFDGWRKLYDKTLGGDEQEMSNGLPKLEVGEEVNAKEFKPTQKFTQPPPRFNEASLIKTLEELGIGRPSTYAPIISTIQDRNYVEKKEKLFAPTSLGFAVTDFLLKNFPDILDYQFTARMEDDLDLIASGEKQKVPILKEFYEPFAKKLGTVGKTAERVAVRTEATGEKCPKCKEGNVVIRLGRYGKFLSCDRFPDCNYRAPYMEKVGNIKCPKCGGDVVYKKTKKGKGFYGCANWPKCNFASWHKPSALPAVPTEAVQGQSQTPGVIPSPPKLRAHKAK